MKHPSCTLKKGHYLDLDNLKLIETNICTYFNISWETLQLKSTKQNVVLYRQLAFYLAKKHTLNSLQRIGDYFGGKGHANVLHSIKTINNRLETEKKIREYVEFLENCITYKDMNFTPFY